MGASTSPFELDDLPPGGLQGIAVLTLLTAQGTVDQETEPHFS
jgi:hypothetical protein